MVHFNELYITEDGKRLVIDAEIDNLPEYADCYIDNITVRNLDNCDEGKQAVSVTVYERTPIIIGDLDNDGKVTAHDYETWKMLLHLMTSKPRVDENGNYYTKVIDDDDVEQVVMLDDYVMGLYNNIVNNHRNLYPDLFPGNRNTIGYFFSYIIDILGRDITTVFPGYSGELAGDFNIDGMLTIDDINAFLDFLFDISNNTKDPVESTTLYVNKSRIRLCLSAADLSPLATSGAIPDDLYVVHVEAGMAGDIEAIEKLGCGYDEQGIDCVVFNGKPLYDAAVTSASSYGNTCNDNDARGFMDFILRYYAFEFALKAGDLCKARYYYNNYLKGHGSVLASSKNCGCHGVY